jgi:hypothetical protein
MENAGIKLFVSVVLGIVIALFVGVGISVFYPEPTYPTESISFTNSEPTEAEIEASDRAYDEYESKRQIHSGVVGVVSVILAVALMISSMLLSQRNLVISQGMLVGGLLLLCYGAIQAIASGNTVTAFISIGVGLAALVVFILRRFKPTTTEASTA